MQEIAIIGGGVCGIALADRLQRRGRSFVLLEARTRLGGRVLSLPCGPSGSRVDLGPSWFWPDTQPLMSRLIGALGLAHFPQHDTGMVLHLRDPDKSPERTAAGPLHGGARRIEGGMGSLVEALRARIDPSRIRLAHRLTDVSDRGDHVSLGLDCDGRRMEILARRVVLALPPRLVCEHVRFQPELDEPIGDAMRQTPTWMAARAKMALAAARASWRDAGLSGNAFVSHGQAILDEIFDACDETARNAALGGFVALPAELRGAFRDGMALLMGNQMAQLFGAAIENGEQRYQDWACERFTCATLDRETTQPADADFANPLLRGALWNGKLHLGGSETASQGAGLLEGALDAARRLGWAMTFSQEADCHDGDEGATNRASVARFARWVADCRTPTLESYRHRLDRRLALRQRERLTQHAVLETIEAVFGDALAMLDELKFDHAGVAVERGRSALTPEILAPFRDFMKSLMDDVVSFNRASTALSNLPDEHLISGQTMQAILRDIAAAWREFSLMANRLLLSKQGGTP